MSNYATMLPHIEGIDYADQFWNAARGKKARRDELLKGMNKQTNAFTITPAMQKKYSEFLKKQSLFRTLATDICTYNSNGSIKTVNEKDIAVWVPEGGSIPLSDVAEDFENLALDSHKLATFLKIEEDFVKDASFNFEDYLLKRFAKDFGRGEDDAFINGTGVNMPTGILADNGGAAIGAKVQTITYEDIVKLFFSVEPEYRKNAVWLVNDETAYQLRTLKDEGGNYIWNHTNDTILGKKVCINEFMPSAASGAKPIAFGDFGYYWIVNRSPLSVRTLTEQFIISGCIGYLAFELLDGKLLNPEAIKVLQIADTNV